DYNQLSLRRNQSRPARLEGDHTADTDQNGHRRHGASEKRPGGDARAAAEGPLDIAPGQYRQPYRQQDHEAHLQVAERMDVDVAGEDDQRPVPEIERVGDQPGEDQ